MRGRQDLAALAYSAFCPSHVKIAGDDNTDPDVPGPELLPLPTYPYHPLIPFESEDRGLFTGREDDTIRCAGLLDEAATRGLVLHGTGGVGKSSLLARRLGASFGNRSGRLLGLARSQAGGTNWQRKRLPRGSPAARLATIF